MNSRMTDDSNLNKDEVRDAVDKWLKQQTKEYMDPMYARFRLVTHEDGILQLVGDQ